MYNAVVLGLNIPLMITIIILFAFALRTYRQTRRFHMFLLVSFCVIGWLATDIAVLVVSNGALNTYIWDLGFIFVAFAPVATFFLFFHFYLSRQKIPLYITLLILVIPIANTVLAITSYWHDIIRTVEVISVWPVRKVVIDFHAWFWIVTFYCYIMTAAGIVVLFYGYLQRPKYYRLPSVLFVAALALMFAANFLFITEVFPMNIDPTAKGVALAVIFMRIALRDSSEGIFAQMARGQVLNYLEEYILIMNKDRRIVDYNRGARKWFATWNIGLYHSTLSEVMEGLKNAGAEITNAVGGENTEDIHIKDENDFPLILNLRTHEMKDKNGRALGAFSIFSNVTENRILIERLDKKAGVDYLTGLPNRTAYEGAKSRFSAPQFLPLSVIMGDVNGLKVTNDNLGHKHGDMLIQIISEVLEKTFPRHMFVGRIGGDEFVILLPRTKEEEALEYIAKTRDAIDVRNRYPYDYPFILSLALGTATKMNSFDDLENVVALADQRMYSDKKRIKKETAHFIKQDEHIINQGF